MWVCARAERELPCLCQTCFFLGSGATSLDIPALFPSENKQSPFVVERIAKHQQLCLKQQLSSLVLVARNAKAAGKKDFSSLNVEVCFFFGTAALLPLSSAENQDLRPIWKWLLMPKLMNMFLKLMPIAFTSCFVPVSFPNLPSKRECSHLAPSLWWNSCQ